MNTNGSQIGGTKQVVLWPQLLLFFCSHIGWECFLSLWPLHVLRWSASVIKPMLTATEDIRPEAKV